jgi:hypothetical protein
MSLIHGISKVELTETDRLPGAGSKDRDRNGKMLITRKNFRYKNKYILVIELQHDNSYHTVIHT